MDKDAEIKSLEKLAALFGTTAEELYERTNNPDEVSEASEDLKKEIEKMLSTLSPRERDVLMFRYFVKDGHPQTLEGIANLFGVTTDTIRQVEENAKAKLRKLITNN